MLVTDPGAMSKKRHPRNDDSLLEIVRILVFVQLAIAIVTAIESMLFGAFSGSAGPALLTLGAAGLTTVFYIGLGRRSPRARRWLIRFQVGWIAFASIDLLLAIFLAGRVLAPIPLLTRIVLPYAIFRMLRKPAVQAEFWAAPDPDSLIADPTTAEEQMYAMA